MVLAESDRPTLQSEEVGDAVIQHWSDQQFEWGSCQPLRVMGAMSGTSVDGIDVACVDIRPGTSGSPLELSVVAADSYNYEPQLRDRILAIASGQPISIEELSHLDEAIATAFAKAIQKTITSQDVRAIDLIGSHGQTVFHRPPTPKSPLGTTVQLGRGATIAHLTDCTTVSNFRVADMAAGGHGAPLVPRLDDLFLSHPAEYRCIQNIGGIGNVTALPPQTDRGRVIKGWDTGPGNVLMDLAVAQFSKGEQAYDQNGAWAAQGTACTALIDQWLEQDFLLLAPPKSTGRELYSPVYLQERLGECDCQGLSQADTLATLTDFTARSIVDSYRRFLPQLPDRVGIGGGGARNLYLMQRLQTHFGDIPVTTTAELGMDSDAKEAIAFAVLAYLRWHAIPGNVPSVTGAREWCLLGEIFRAT